MSQCGIHFANDWISDAIDALDAGVGRRPAVIIDEWVTQLLVDAAAEGITRDEIEEGVGDLASYIAACLAEAGKHGSERK